MTVKKSTVTRPAPSRQTPTMVRTDGAEVAGSNWMPRRRRKELKVEVGKAIILEGIVFATGKADVPKRLLRLETAYNTLEQNPETAFRSME
jgi:hypothetical protein